MLTISAKIGYSYSQTTHLYIKVKDPNIIYRIPNWDASTTNLSRVGFLLLPLSRCHETNPYNVWGSFSAQLVKILVVSKSKWLHFYIFFSFSLLIGDVSCKFLQND